MELIFFGNGLSTVVLPLLSIGTPCIGVVVFNYGGDDDDDSSVVLYHLGMYY